MAAFRSHGSQQAVRGLSLRRCSQDWALQPSDVADVVLDLLRSPARALYSRVEPRPSRPPRKG